MMRERKMFKGFTLLELSIVLIIISVIISSTIMLTSAGLSGLAYNTTMSKMKVLQQALYDHRIAYGRLPCPANNSLYEPTDENYGIEAAQGEFGNCYGGVPSVANDPDMPNAPFGMVPVRTLGLPDDAALDGWGRIIHYVVNADATRYNGAVNDLPITNDVSLYVINNDSGTTIDQSALYVLISHGKNGHGARTITKASVSTGSTNSNELLNCKCDSAAAYDSNLDAIEFVQGVERPNPMDPLAAFDDVVVFANRLDLRDPTRE